MSRKCSSIDQIWCRVLGRKVVFQITFGRPGTRVSTKIHCDFTQIHCDFHKKYTLATVASLAGSRTPPPVPGPQQGMAWRSILAATPSTAAISTPFLNGNSANPLLYSSNEERSTSTARSHGARKNHPHGPKFSIFSFLQKQSSSL